MALVSSFTSWSGTSSSSRLRRGVPVVISVKTDWFRAVRVVAAAERRAVMMEGPGKMWAFVRWAQVAIATGPRVY